MAHIGTMLIPTLHVPPHALQTRNATLLVLTYCSGARVPDAVSSALTDGLASLCVSSLCSALASARLSPAASWRRFAIFGLELDAREDKRPRGAALSAASGSRRCSTSGCPELNGAPLSRQRPKRFERSGDCEAASRAQRPSRLKFQPCSMALALRADALCPCFLGDDLDSAARTSCSCKLKRSARSLSVVSSARSQRARHPSTSYWRR